MGHNCDLKKPGGKPGGGTQKWVPKVKTTAATAQNTKVPAPKQPEVLPEVQIVTPAVAPTQVHPDDDGGGLRVKSSMKYLFSARDKVL